MRGMDCSPDLALSGSICRVSIALQPQDAYARVKAVQGQMRGSDMKAMVILVAAAAASLGVSCFSITRLAMAKELPNCLK